MAYELEVRVGVGAGSKGDLMSPCLIWMINQMPLNTRMAQKNMRYTLDSARRLKRGRRGVMFMGLGYL